MERPDSVSLVAPPTRTIAKTSAATANSQTCTPRVFPRAKEASAAGAARLSIADMQGSGTVRLKRKRSRDINTLAARHK